MPDISVVGVRLVVEGSEESVAKIEAVDAAAKSTSGSLRAVGSDDVTKNMAKVTSSLNEVEAGTKKAASSTDGFAKSMKNLDSTLSTVSSTMMRFSLLGGLIGGGGLVAGLGLAGLAAATFGVVAGTSIDRTRTSFEALLGSVARGDALFKSLQGLEQSTPMALADLTSAAGTLLQGGYTDTGVLPLLKTLATVSGTASTAAESTADLQKQAAVFAQMKTTGLIQASDVTALQGTNFPIAALLQQAGLSQQQLLAGGKYQADDLLKLVEGGGGSALDPFRQAAGKTSTGLGEEVRHFIATLKNDLADASKPLSDDMARKLIPISDSLKKTLDTIMPQFDKFFISIVDRLPTVIEKLAPMMVSLMNGLEKAGPGALRFLQDFGSVLHDLGGVFVTLLPLLDGALKLFHDFVNLPFGIGSGAVAGLLVALLGYNMLAGPIKMVWGMAAAMDGLATAEGRAALGQKLGALGTLGKVAGGVGGAAGLGASLYDAHQAGPSLTNVAGGAVSGAVLGATVGSIFPGVGTAIGAAAGGLIGGAASFVVGETTHHVTINVNGADPQAVTKQIDQYYRNVNRRAGVPATP